MNLFIRTRGHWWRGQTSAGRIDPHSPPPPRPPHLPQVSGVWSPQVACSLSHMILSGSRLKKTHGRSITWKESPMRCTPSICPMPSWACPSLQSVSKYPSVCVEVKGRLSFGCEGPACLRRSIRLIVRNWVQTPICTVCSLGILEQNASSCACKVLIGIWKKWVTILSKFELYTSLTRWLPLCVSLADFVMWSWSCC